MRRLVLPFVAIGYLVALCAVQWGVSRWLIALLGGLIGTLLIKLLSPPQREPNVVLVFGGVEWTEEEFCRGWEIDGRTGSGKTACGVVPIIYQLKARRPDVGILVLDTKGDLSEPLTRIAASLKCPDQLAQLEVRPDNATEQWKPIRTMNFLADTSIPYSTYAKMLVDIATAAGQKGGQAFFKVAAQTIIKNTLTALSVLGRPVTVSRCAAIIANEPQFKEMAGAIEDQSRTRPELRPLVQYFYEFVKQPREQLGGVCSTVANYLEPFIAPDIAQVFDAEKPTFSLSEIDQGKLISVKIPQKYQVEKKYVSLLLKTIFYMHALRRYDLSYEARAKKKLIVMVLDEAQETVLVSEDGMSDYNVVDKIRGARATTINSTQSPTSYIPPMGNKEKAEVFLLNLGNKIYFTAADNQASDMIADAIGKHTVQKRTYGHSGGKRTMNWKEEDEHWVKAHQLRALPKHYAIIKHCEKAFRRVHLRPTEFTLPKLASPLCSYSLY